MTLKSVNYPVKHSVPEGEYNVYESDCGGNQSNIFRGVSYSGGNGDNSVIDIAEIAKYRFDINHIVLPEIDNSYTYINTETSHTYNSVAFGNNMYVAVGNDGWAAISTDNGKTWDEFRIATPQGYYYDITRIRYFNNGYFFICIRNNFIGYSSDGRNYTMRQYLYGNTSPYAFDIGKASTSTSLQAPYFVVSSLRYYTYTLSNPDNFTVAIDNNLPTAQFNAVVFADSYGLAVGNSGNMIRLRAGSVGFTTDAFTNGTNNWNDLIFVNNQYVVVGNNGQIVTTTDRENFNSYSAGSFNIKSIIYNNNTYYISGDGFIGESADLINWEFSRVDHSFNSIVGNGLQVIAVGNGILSRISTSGINIDSNTLVKDFNVDGSDSYTISYDYNTEYISDIGETRLNTDPISNLISVGQFITMSVYDSVCDRLKTFSVALNGEILTTETSTSRSSQAWIDSGKLGVVPGDVITLACIGGAGNEFAVDYKVTDQCPVRYVVYYLNKFGSIDPFLMRGQVIESFTNDQFNINTFYDRSSSQNFQRKTIQNTALRSWQMNTGILKDAEAAKIDHLFLSPRVWVHDLIDDIIYAATIADSALSISEFKQNRRAANYTITIQQSQDITRR